MARRQCQAQSGCHSGRSLRRGDDGACWRCIDHGLDQGGQGIDGGGTCRRFERNCAGNTGVNVHPAHGNDGASRRCAGQEEIAVGIGHDACKQLGCIGHAVGVGVNVDLRAADVTVCNHALCEACGIVACGILHSSCVVARCGVCIGKGYCRAGGKGIGQREGQHTATGADAGHFIVHTTRGDREGAHSRQVCRVNVAVVGQGNGCCRAACSHRLRYRRCCVQRECECCGCGADVACSICLACVNGVAAHGGRGRCGAPTRGAVGAVLHRGASFCACDSECAIASDFVWDAGACVKCQGHSGGCCAGIEREAQGCRSGADVASHIGLAHINGVAAHGGRGRCGAPAGGAVAAVFHSCAAISAADRERAIAGDLVCGTGACIGCQGHCGGCNRGVNGEGQCGGVGTHIASRIGLAHSDRLDSVTCQGEAGAGAGNPRGSSIGAVFPCGAGF